MSQINQDLYNKILENMPIICVDGVITNKDNKILFIKRENEPAKDEWWFPGGRLIKNELLEDAIIRKVKEETNLDVSIVSYLGFTETKFDTGPFGIPVHTINFTYHLVSNSYNNLKIDCLHSDFIWSDEIDELRLNSQILNLLKEKLIK
jgi:colanic acid biosynthesis protein WcaH